MVKERLEVVFVKERLRSHGISAEVFQRRQGEEVH